MVIDQSERTDHNLFKEPLAPSEALEGIGWAFNLSSTSPATPCTSIAVLDDDKIQDLLYEATQIGKPPIELDMDGSAANTTLNSLNASASELKDQGTRITPQFSCN